MMPMRENIPAGRCKICGDAIFVGDLAYYVFGYSCCYGCIDSSAYVADGGDGLTCDDGDEHLFECSLSEERKGKSER